MTENEKKLLIALVKMVGQHLHRYGDEVDNIAESAGEHAIQVLADFGLMELINTRFGRWTEAGKKFIADNALWPEPAAPTGGIRLVGRSEPKS